MTVVAIKCTDGRYLCVDRQGRATTRRWHYLFDMQQAAAGFTFRIVASHDYLCLNDGELGAKEAPSGEEGAFELFVREGGLVSMRAADGRSIADGGGGRFVAGDGAVLFEIERLALSEAVEDALEKNCAHSLEKWKEATHVEIVSTGIQTLLLGHRGRSDVKPFFDKLWSSSHFQTGLFQGLKEADTNIRFTQYPFFPWHFYDPTTGNNWMGVGPTARSVGTYYTTKSMVAAAALFKPGPHPDRAYFNCGRDLGLALHFFTDLTQPMHAANFTETHSPSGRHGEFEKFINDNRAEIWRRWPAQLSSGDLDAVKAVVEAGTFQISRFFHDTAYSAWLIWQRPLSGWIIAGKKLDLEEPAIQTVIKETVQRAPDKVARLVFAYTLLIAENAALVDESKWYRIKEHTQGKWMSWVREVGILNHVRRWDPGLEENRHDFCFVPDGSGSYRIVGRHNFEWAWYMVQASNNSWYFADMRYSENPQYNAFYLEHAGVFDGKTRVRIIEPVKEERITVSWGWPDENGRAVGWGEVTEPDRLQTFELVEVATMSEEEHRKITDYWDKKIHPKP